MYVNNYGTVNVILFILKNVCNAKYLVCIKIEYWTE